jgi:hypothetical protein
MECDPYISEYTASHGQRFYLSDASCNDVMIPE